MRNFLASLSSQQPVDLEGGSGLPYWIFWMLIFVIALLLVFIFLRDKDLRRRLDGFFQGIKNRLRKLRLQTTLKKEKQRHEYFMFELGSKAWEEDVEVPTAQNLRDELAHLEKQRADTEDQRSEIEEKIAQIKRELEDFEKKQEAEYLRLEAELKPYADRIDEIRSQEKALEQDMARQKSAVDAAAKEIAAAHKQLLSIEDKGDVLEEVKKFELESLKEKVQSLESRKTEAEQALARLAEQKGELSKELEEQDKSRNEFQKKLKQNKDRTKEQAKRFHKDIKEWEKQRDKATEKMEQLEGKKKPLLRELGELVDKERVDHEDLEILYSKIDRTKVKTQELEELIKDLEE